MRLYGLKVDTDWADLRLLLEQKHVSEKELDTLIPGFRIAVLEALREIEGRQLRPELLVYRCFRVLVFAQPGFDAEPSTSRRVLPADVVVYGPLIH